MNIILCVAARHLAVLQPEDTRYPIAAGSLLGRALSHFSQELSNSLTSTHIDAFVATSFLLQYEIWNNADYFSPPDAGAGSFDKPRDHLFAVSSSLKQVFLKNLALVSNQPSVFLPHMPYDPRNVLAKAAQVTSGTLVDYQDFFSYKRPLCLELLSIPPPIIRGTELAISDVRSYCEPNLPDEPNRIQEAYVFVITRLCLILSFLLETRPPHSVCAELPLLSELARYIFTFPVQCYGPFTSMIEEGNPHALLLLYHFYRAVRILLPPAEYWWAHRRAAFSELMLKEQLFEEDTKQRNAYS
ncbi:Fc.00g025180.m01.CDS01 [Cosmosporella sp. VM-42]